MSLGEHNCTGNKATPRHDRMWIPGPKQSELDPSRDEDRHQMLLTLLADEMAKDTKPPDVWSRGLPCPLTTQGEQL